MITEITIAIVTKGVSGLNSLITIPISGSVKNETKCLVSSIVKAAIRLNNAPHISIEKYIFWILFIAHYPFRLACTELPRFYVHFKNSFVFIAFRQYSFILYYIHHFLTIGCSNMEQQDFIDYTVYTIKTAGSFEKEPAV